MFLSRLAVWMNNMPFCPLFLPNNYYWLFLIVENVSLKVNIHYFSILDSYNKTCLFGASCKK